MLRRIRTRLGRSPLARRFASGMFWTTVNGVVSRVLSLASGIVLARIFGSSEYGAYGMIQGTVGMFGAFSGFGIGLTATKHVAEYRDGRNGETADVIALSSSVALISGALFSAVLYLAAGTLANRLLGAPHMERPLRISALLLLLSNVAGAQTGVLSGFESFRRMAYVAAAGAVISFGALVGGGMWFGLDGAVWGLVAGQAAVCVLGHLAVVRTARANCITLRLWGGFRSKHLLWRFAVPATLASSLVTPVSWACSAMLVNRPGGFAQVGLFNAANQWFGLVMFLPGLLGQALIPIMSERLGQGDSRASKRILWMTSALNGAVATAIIVVVWSLGPVIARLYGRGFEATPAVLNVALITGGLLAIQAPVGHVLVASGRMWVGFVMNLGWGACFLGATSVLVNRGAVGLAEARLIAYVVHGIWTGWFALRVLRGGDMTST